MSTNYDPTTGRTPRHPDAGGTHLDAGHADRRKVSWGAIFAGVVAAVAITILLGLLGAGIGLWAVEPGGERDSIAGMTIGTMVYSVIVQLIALFAGGYVAARMSSNWDKQNAMLHGATVWGLAVIFGVWLTVSVVGTVVNTAFSAVKNSAEAVSSAVATVVPDEMPDIEIPDIGMEDLPQDIQETLREEGITPQNFRAEAREAFRNVISEEEQEEVISILVQTAKEVVRSPGEARSEIDSAIDELFGQGGVISQEDREEALAVLENRFGITPEQAEATFQTWQDNAIAAYEEAKETIVETAEEAIEMGDAATDAVGTASFWSFVGLLLGLGAAVFGAMLGRREHPAEHSGTAPATR